jgi:carbamoyltransferase
MFNLGLQGSHNASAAIAYNDEILEVVELERFLNIKNAQFKWNREYEIARLAAIEFSKYFQKKYNVQEYENVVWNRWDPDLLNIFPAKNHIFCRHHYAHAYSALYQSPYKKALIVSWDGGSEEGYFNVYVAEKYGRIEKIYQGEIDYAICYMAPAHFIADIKQESNGVGMLVYAGKIMGLAGYGQVNDKFLEPMFEFYRTGKESRVIETYERFIKYFGKFGITGPNVRVGGSIAADLAATNQYVFETMFEEEMKDIFEKYKHLPTIMTGGCSLNVLNNTRVAKYREVFVPPNPNDCGLTTGMVAIKVLPKTPVDCTYIGPEVWDHDELARHVYERKAVELNLTSLADKLISGQIVGVVRGRSEHGPRALGNRSIICDPTIEGMKDILNAKVKGREFYRPFAPVVRLEDVNKYFEWDKESRWMSFAPPVREEYRNILKAITHVDGTARVQTVTREQNQFLYDLLTIMHEKKGIGVLLNTSFNIAGKPILNTYKDALWVLDNKDMDGVVFEDYYIAKSK